MIDNYDSFTYNLVQAFRELGAEMQVFRNDKIDVEGIRALSPSALILSPGPGNPDSAGVTLDAINAKVFPNERAAGTTAQRPTNIEVGYCYFDTSLGSGTPPNGKPIWASKITESTDIITGEVTRSVTWVDATGTVV